MRPVNDPTNRQDSRSRRGARTTQLLKGVLDMLLLALIAQQARYGYELVEELGRRGLELVSEGSIYPVLARLERMGLIAGRFEPSPQGPPRKYYHLQEAGRATLQQWVDDWRRFETGVARVLRKL